MVSLYSLSATGAPLLSAKSAPNVHVEEEDFFVYSPTVPIARVASCEVLDKLLPGRLGTYVLPRDAVLVLTSWNATSRPCVQDVKDFIQREETKLASDAFPRFLEGSASVANDVQRRCSGDPDVRFPLPGEENLTKGDIDCLDEACCFSEEDQEELYEDDDDESGSESDVEDEREEEDAEISHALDSESEDGKSDDDTGPPRCRRTCQQGACAGKAGSSSRSIV